MAVVEGWNAHNNIGLSLEMSSILINRMELIILFSVPIALKQDASWEAMVCLLRHIYGYTCNENIDTIIEGASEFFGKSVQIIKPEIAQDLLDSFIELIPKY